MPKPYPLQGSREHLALVAKISLKRIGLLSDYHVAVVVTDADGKFVGVAGSHGLVRTEAILRAALDLNIRGKPRKKPTKVCHHIWHERPALLTPCPECGDLHGQ